MLRHDLYKTSSPSRALRSGTRSSVNWLIAVLALVACGGNSNTHHDAAIDAPPDAPPIPTGLITIALNSLDQLSYTGPLQTGGQMQVAIMDTGSTTLGVASNTCGNCGVTPLYTPGNSAVDQHATGTSTYADGTGWSGEIYSDYVQLGSGADVPVDFVAIGSSSGFFRSFDSTGDIGYQGILGLGPDGSLLTGTTSYLSTAFDAGVTKEFAFQLCPTDGTMWVGGVDASAEASPPAVTALDSSLPAYVVGVDDVAVGSGSSFGSASDYGFVIIDTGTSIAFLPTTPLADVTSAIEASAGYLAIFGSDQSLDNDTGCVDTGMSGSAIDAALPPFHVAFPDATTGSDTPYVDLPATKAYLVFGGPDPQAGTGQNAWCYGFADASELGGGGSNPNLSLFGDSLLNAFTTIFDVGSQTMGFSAQAGCPEADDVARATTPPRPHAHGSKWWKQDPRVRVPSPAEIKRRLTRVR